MTKFLMISRVLYEKGYSEFVGAAAQIRRRHPDCTFMLMGDLDTAPHHVPRKVVEADVASGSIEYLGFRTDIIEMIGSVDCIVHPSFYNEGMSRVLMEALALHKPVITTRIPGCRELVEENVNGFLCDPQDTQGLVDAIEKFLALTDAERHAMGEAGRRLAEEKFDIRNVVNIYHSLTDHILRGNT